MKINEIGLPDNILEIFMENGLKELYPPQAEAIPKILEGKNLVIAIPTASGKSLLAYIAILRGFLKGMKSIYVVPLRALASEKYEDLKRFEAIGLKVKLAIGDYDSSTKILKDADVVVATSEKFDSLLRHDFNYIYDLGVIVIDEIHMLKDPDRGPTLEMILTKIKSLNTSAQLIALSATIKNYKELAKWLNAEYIFSEFRPVPLKIGIYEPSENLLKFDSGEIMEVESDRLIIGNLVKRALENDGQVLIFVNTRSAAETLSESLRNTARKYIKEEVTYEFDEEDVYDKKIKENVSYGVCFHHAGLSNKQRKEIEDLFKARKIKILTATPTLAAGVNLPSRTVIIRDITRFDGGGSVRIPYIELKQMLGRAGRQKYDKYGEAIIVSKKSNLEFEELDKIEEIESYLVDMTTLKNNLLGLISSGMVKTELEIYDFFKNSFYGLSEDVNVLESHISELLSFLEEHGFIENKRIIKSTIFGKKVSDLYISPDTALLYRDSFDYDYDQLSVLYTISDSLEMIPLFCKKSEIDGLKFIINKKIKENCKFFKDKEIDYNSLKTALMLSDWINESSNDQIISKYVIGPGDIHSKVELADWLLYSYLELGRVERYKHLENVKELWERVKYGTSRELIPLTRLNGVGRVRARRLYDAGLIDIHAIKNASIEDLAKIPGIGLSIANSIKKQVE
ncbi:MAG: DEAD/DEAH box helicase [Thermoplasmata archaeon]